MSTPRATVTRGPDPIATFGGPATCPSCGHVFAGQWQASLDDWEGNPAADQACPECGAVFAATWPGFTFEPDTVVIGEGEQATP
jgi:ribosomal protein S27AE